MRTRKRLGTARTDAAVNQHGVNVAAIPYIERGYELWRVGEVGIGGAAPKDFLVFPSYPALSKAYVAKQPSRKHSGFRESVTEYLIARIGHHLPLRMARARLVRLRGPRGAPEDVRFLSRYFLRPGEQSLIHGVELVAQAYGVQKSEVAQAAERNESLFYTADMIDEVLAEVSRSDHERDRLRDGFARMMAFDALVGANDRHAENWGVIEDVRTSRLLAFAPIYDTARGLFLRLEDTELEDWYQRGSAAQRIEAYARKSESLIGTGVHERPNHFQVFEHMARDARFRGPLVQVVHAFSPKLLRSILCNEFHSLLSRTRLRAIADLLAFRHAVLIEICKTSRPRVP